VFMVDITLPYKSTHFAEIHDVRFKPYMMQVMMTTAPTASTLNYIGSASNFVHQYPLYNKISCETSTTGSIFANGSSGKVLLTGRNAFDAFTSDDNKTS
jgi:hypothetical protein